MRIQPNNISVDHNFHMQKEGEKWLNGVKYNNNLKWRIKRPKELAKELKDNLSEKDK